MEIQMETERLVICRLTMQDTEALLAIMGKPEVMYAWEHGFTHADVVQWIERQLARYRDDGYGYFALELKGEGKVIGQAGLMKTASTAGRLWSSATSLMTATGIWAMQAKPPVNACAMHQWIWGLLRYIAA